MLSKNNVQHIKSLQFKKFRDKHREFVVEGPKLGLELLASDFKVKCIYATSDWLKQNVHLIEERAQIVQITKAELDRISGLKTPNSMLSLAEIPARDLDPTIAVDQFVLAVDGIRDPGNLGTMIRTADWFGIKTMICSLDTVELFNPKVVQSTMGSLFRVKVFYTDLPEFLSNLDVSIPVFGAFLDGENMYSLDFESGGVVVMGSESHGIRPQVEEKIKTRLHIPAINSKAESLNASIATAICLSEIKRSVLKNI